MKLAHILKKPIITERSLKAVKQGKYTFKVDKGATKGQIKQAVEDFFKVSVISVNTLKLAGKRHRVGKLRRKKIEPSSKKAIVLLKKGDKISLFEEQK